MKRRNWQQFALLLIDVQEDFWNQELERAFPNFRENVAHLLSFCRQEGLEVIHLREVFNPDGSDWLLPYRLRGRAPCVRGTSGAAVLDCAGERPGEVVIEKQTLDGFHNPQLLDCLRRRDKRFVLAAGLVTSVCVLFTSASAAQLGFLTAVVEDCCADYPEAHAMVLKRYRGFLLEFVKWERIAECYANGQELLEQLNAGRI